jgi:hypothetical protein
MAPPTLESCRLKLNRSLELMDSIRSEYDTDSGAPFSDRIKFHIEQQTDARGFW